MNLSGSPSALVSLQGLEGTDLRSARDNNRILEEVRGQQDPLCTLLAEIRWLHYQLSRLRYAEAVGLHVHAIENSETAFSRPEHETYSAIYRKWAGDGIGLETRGRMLDLVTMKNRQGDRETPLEEFDPNTQTVAELYWRWSYMSGLPAFEKAADLSSGGLWQREYTGVIPDCDEVRALARKLKHDPEEAVAVWTRDKLRQMEGRGVERPMREFLARLEAATPAFAFTPQGLRKILGCTDRVADALCHCEPVPLDQIEEAARRIIPAAEWEDFAGGWLALEAQYADRDTFAKAFVRARDAQGITNRQLSLELGIVAPEMRAGAAEPDESRRKEGYRPSAEIRRTLEANDFSSQAPAGVLIELVGREVTVGPRREPERDYMRRLFLELLDERARKTGRTVGRSLVRRTRQLWGVPLDGLEDLGWDHDRLLEIENNKGEDEVEDVLRAIEGEGMEKARQALAGREQATTDRHELLTGHPTTVAEVVGMLRKRHNGLVGIARALKGDAAVPHEIKAVPQLKRIELGELVPSLPSVRAILRNAGNEEERLALDRDDPPEFLQDVVRDWYLRYPDELLRRPKKPWTSPLARFFGVVFGEHAASLKQFWEQRITDVSYPVLTRNIQVLNNGDTTAWANLSRYLDAADLAPGPRRRFGEILHADGKVRPAVVAWRKEVKRDQEDPEPYEHMLGLSEKERRLCGIEAGRGD